MTEPTISGEETSQFVRDVLLLCAAIVPPEHQAEFFAGLREKVVKLLDEEERPSRPHLRVVDIDPD